MTELSGIRAWAREQGLDVPARGPVGADIRAAYQEWLAGGDTEPPPLQPGVTFTAEDDDDSGPVPVPDEPPPGADRAPPGPWWQRKRGSGQPARRRPRVSIENVVSSGWTLGAMMLARSPRSLPVARVLDMQAPVAGAIVDDVARGTILDAMLQPFARAGEKGQQAVALLGPPLLVGAIVAKPELYPVVRPMLKMSIVSWMEISGPAAKRAERKAKRFAEQYGEVDIDGMIDMLFAPPPGWQQPAGGSQNGQAQQFQPTET